MNPVSLDDAAVRSLAQFRPFEGGAEGLAEVHAELVEAACQSNGGGFRDLASCASYLQKVLKVELEDHEISGAQKELVRMKRAESNGGGIELTAVRREELAKRREGWEKAELLAMEEWEIAVRTEYPFLDDAEVDELRDQVRPWLERVIAVHGAEASLLLYPGHERREALNEAIAETNLGFLPSCSPSIRKIRPGAFWLLVREPTAAQREFLGRLLNTGFYLTILSIDPKANHLVKAEAKKRTLYLDTNFLYALLGVGGATEGISAKRLMSLCANLGFSLRVTPWTTDELRTSIASNRAEVERTNQSRKAAEVMAAVSGEKGFAAAFWKTLTTQEVDVRTFFGKYEHFMHFLDEFGIKEHPEGCAEVEGEPERVRIYSSPLEGMYGVGAKERVVIEHDAKMRILIEDLRGGSDWGSFSDVGYWVLTESTKLPVYGRLPIGSGARPRHPFCILSSSWAQIVRAMVPRTDDLDDMIVGLLASPYVGYKSPFVGDHLRAVERTVARIDNLKDVPPAVAVALVEDDAMASRIAEESDQNEVSRIVEEGLSQKAEELQTRLGRSAEEKVRSDRERLEAEERARAATERETLSIAEQEEAKRKADEAEARATVAEESARKAKEEEAALQQSLRESQAEHRAEADQRTSAERRERRYRNALATVVGVLILAGGCTLLLTGAVSGPTGSIAVALSTVALVYVDIRLVSQALAREVVALATVLAAIVAVLALVLAPGTSQSRAPEGASKGAGSEGPAAGQQKPAE